MSSKLKILPVGGCGEIGKNMTVLEYEDDIVIVDAGIMFPQNDMLGIDFIIPDYKYVVERREKVRGVLITHGHEDHVGAIGHLMGEIDAPIYATRLTKGLLELKLREYDGLEDVVVHEITPDDTFEVGCFTVEPFHVTHSIPDCVGFAIDTPVGLVVHTGDYKFDYTPVDEWPPDFAKLAEFSSRGVLCLLGDSTNVHEEGWTKSEADIEKAFDELFATAPGRIIVVSFASLISRIQQVAWMAEKHGRRLAITGRSMRENSQMARDLGYLTVDEDNLIDIDQANSLPGNKVVIMATGSQGEPRSVLGRLATGRHRTLGIRKGDTVVISAHTIPGNEEPVYRIINRLLQRGANVLYEENADVHVSGHASRDEMKLMLNLVRPRFFIPIHGELRHLKEHARLAESVGIWPEHIAVVENGTPVEMDEETMIVHDRLPGGYIFVDGARVGEIGWSVMRDRDKLAQDGFFHVFVSTNSDGQLLSKPEVTSRGFANFKADPELLDGAIETVEKAVDSYTNQNQTLTSRVEEALARYLYEETGRRPLIFASVK
ncbi:MAG: ribonuclease J [Ardenticatenales bacterium]|nr:ribonuclease J [Ardenticatenales bacterium]